MYCIMPVGLTGERIAGVGTDAGWGMGGRAADTLDGGRVVVGVGAGRPGGVLDDMINAEIVAPAAAEPAAIRASVDFDMTDDQCLV